MSEAAPTAEQSEMPTDAPVVTENAPAVSVSTDGQAATEGTTSPSEAPDSPVSEDQSVPASPAPTADTPPAPETAPVAAPALIPGLTEGRIVHYVLYRGQGANEHRPAIVVKDWKKASGSCNLVVFLDGRNDNSNYYGEEPLCTWQTSVSYSEDAKPGTWHFPERV